MERPSFPDAPTMHTFISSSSSFRGRAERHDPPVVQDPDRIAIGEGAGEVLQHPCRYPFRERLLLFAAVTCRRMKDGEW